MERVRPPRQERASRTARALADAAHDLMRRRPLAEVPVAEIVDRAGTSVGAFYARFGCKEALLDWLCRDRLRRDGETIVRRLRELAHADAGLRELVDAYVGMAMEFYERHAVLLREVVHLAYGTSDTRALSQTLRVNDEVDRACVAILMQRRAEMRHPDPERVASFVPLFVAAMLRTFVLLRPAIEGPRSRRNADELRQEIVQWILSSMCAPQP